MKIQYYNSSYSYKIVELFKIMGVENIEQISNTRLNKKRNQFKIKSIKKKEGVHWNKKINLICI